MPAQADTAPPPQYSQHGGDDSSSLQLLIVPALDGINFQKGYVGAEGEHAAVEGEVHLKGAKPGAWKKLSVRPYYPPWSSPDRTRSKVRVVTHDRVCSWTRNRTVPF